MGKEWHQIKNTLDYIKFLEVEKAEALMWGPEMLSELSQVTQWWLSWVRNSHLSTTCSSHPTVRPPKELEKSTLFSKAHWKYPGPERTTFQVQISSHNHFLTSALKQGIRWFFGRAQSSGPDNPRSEKAAPIQGLIVSFRGFSQDLTLGACLLVKKTQAYILAFTFLRLLDSFRTHWESPSQLLASYPIVQQVARSVGLLFVLSHITKNLLALKTAPSKGIDPSRQNWERALALWEWVLRGQQSPLCEEPEGRRNSGEEGWGVPGVWVSPLRSKLKGTRWPCSSALVQQTCRHQRCRWLSNWFEGFWLWQRKPDAATNCHLFQCHLWPQLLPLFLSILISFLTT